MHRSWYSSSEPSVDYSSESPFTRRGATSTEETQNENGTLELFVNFKRFQPYLEERLRTIYYQGREREVRNEVEDIKYYLIVMADMQADVNHGAETLQGFIDNIHEMIRKNPLPEESILPSQDSPANNEQKNEFPRCITRTEIPVVDSSSSGNLKSADGDSISDESGTKDFSYFATLEEAIGRKIYNKKSVSSSDDMMGDGQCDVPFVNTMPLGRGRPTEPTEPRTHFNNAWETESACSGRSFGRGINQDRNRYDFDKTSGHIDNMMGYSQYDVPYGRDRPSQTARFNPWETETACSGRSFGRGRGINQDRYRFNKTSGHIDNMMGYGQHDIPYGRDIPNETARFNQPETESGSSGRSFGSGRGINQDRNRFNKTSGHIDNMIGYGQHDIPYGRDIPNETARFNQPETESASSGRSFGSGRGINQDRNRCDFNKTSGHIDNMMGYGQHDIPYGRDIPNETARFNQPETESASSGLSFGSGRGINQNRNRYDKTSGYIDNMMGDDQHDVPYGRDRPSETARFIQPETESASSGRSFGSGRGINQARNRNDNLLITVIDKSSGHYKKIAVSQSQIRIPSIKENATSKKPSKRQTIEKQVENEGLFILGKPMTNKKPIRLREKMSSPRDIHPRPPSTSSATKSNKKKAPKSQPIQNGIQSKQKLVSKTNPKENVGSKPRGRKRQSEDSNPQISKKSKPRATRTSKIKLSKPFAGVEVDELAQLIQSELLNGRRLTLETENFIKQFIRENDPEQAENIVGNPEHFNKVVNGLTEASKKRKQRSSTFSGSRSQFVGATQSDDTSKGPELNRSKSTAKKSLKKRRSSLDKLHEDLNEMRFDRSLLLGPQRRTRKSTQQAAVGDFGNSDTETTFSTEGAESTFSMGSELESRTGGNKQCIFKAKPKKKKKGPVTRAKAVLKLSKKLQKNDKIQDASDNQNQNKNKLIIGRTTIVTNLGLEKIKIETDYIPPSAPVKQENNNEHHNSMEDCNEPLKDGVITGQSTLDDPSKKQPLVFDVPRSVVKSEPEDYTMDTEAQLEDENPEIFMNEDGNIDINVPVKPESNEDENTAADPFLHIPIIQAVYTLNPPSNSNETNDGVPLISKVDNENHEKNKESSLAAELV